MLDKLKVERERGITIKAQTATMLYTLDGVQYLLNLIDTPGHVDFSYEVSRSLAACQGALLLVDAVQGIQAQTVANFLLAVSKNLTILPIINKVDLPSADPAGTIRQIETTLGLDASAAVQVRMRDLLRGAHAQQHPNECAETGWDAGCWMLQVSAKTGLNVANILPEIVRHMPPYARAMPCCPFAAQNDPIRRRTLHDRPSGDAGAPLRALLFDSWFDEYRGVICLVNIVDGVLRRGTLRAGMCISAGAGPDALPLIECAHQGTRWSPPPRPPSTRCWRSASCTLSRSQRRPCTMRCPPAVVRTRRPH